MARATRVLVPGAVYHVYNRVARGEDLFRIWRGHTAIISGSHYRDKVYLQGV